MAQVLTRSRVQEFYDVYSRRDFDRISDFLHDDVVWTVTGPVDLLAFCGTRNSKAEVIGMHKRVVPSIFRSRRFDVEQMIIEGDQVAVLAKLSGEKLDGRVMSFRVAHFSTFRDGKVVRLRSVIDSFNAVEQTFGVHLEVGDKRQSMPQNENVVAL
jgi:ketosteroid isomerase-like protein